MKCTCLGITDSKEYLKKALEDLKYPIEHISISIEAKFPSISPKIESLRKSIAGILKVDETKVGITATTGEEITSFGRGEGISVIAVLTVGE